ncbi:DNA polymerase III, subunit gamma and tau [Oscillatoriales cyanobacterium USR001]|nr:DNA polymerase III, subunit gamma and tau [Oscillatoriales cyanobacterium USR001]
MTYEPLHHKYRPQTFADLVGQEAIAQTLSNAIRQDRIAPAYLFTGPRGTGKTSSARILAKSLNCLSGNVPTDTPCGKCDVCQGIVEGRTLDVIEIDAASNTGVDSIRDLIEKAQFAPVQCRYKVYAIDECHMLSVSAFNSLLKTLEEPPDRVVFVLATTDAQRVLPTIISRCQRFDFRRIPVDAMTQHLQKIAQLENINIANDAIEMVAQIAQGGLRDAESLLDQLSLFPGEVTIEKVWDLVGAVPENDLMALLEAIASDRAETVLDCVRKLMDRGKEPLLVLQNFAGFYRDLLIAKTAPNRQNLVALTQQTWGKLCKFAVDWTVEMILAGQKHLQSSEIQIKNTTQPRLWLEMTLLGLLPSALKTQMQATGNILNGGTIEPGKNADTSNSKPSSIASGTKQSQNLQLPISQPSQPAATESQNTSGEIIEPETNAEPEFTGKEVDSNNVWQRVLAEIRQPLTLPLLQPHATLASFDGEVAIIWFPSQQLLKRAKDRIAHIEAAFYKVFNRHVTVRLGLTGTQTNSAITKESLTANEGIEEGGDRDTITNKDRQNHQPSPPKPAEKIDRSTNGWKQQPKTDIEAKGVAVSADRQAVTQAVQQLINMFKGEAIDLDESEFSEDISSDSEELEGDFIELPDVLVVDENSDSLDVYDW